MAAAVRQFQLVSEFAPAGDQPAAIDALEADILSACRELADTIYSDLESEHDGYFEEDAFADTAAVNEWEFDENGVLI